MKTIVTVLLAVLLAGCPSVPFRNSLALLSNANAQYTERTIVLRENNLITPQEAGDRLMQIEQVRDALRLAAVAFDKCQVAGDAKCETANSALGVARSLGQQVELELLKREKEKQQ